MVENSQTKMVQTATEDQLLSILSVFSGRQTMSSFRMGRHHRPCLPMYRNNRRKANKQNLLNDAKIVQQRERTEQGG